MLWWFDCFSNRTPRKMLQPWWEGKVFSSVLKVPRARRGKKRGFIQCERKQNIFFYPRCHGVWWVFVWSPLKCIRECCRQNCLQWETGVLVKWRLCAALFLRNKQLLAERVYDNLIVASDSLGLFANTPNVVQVLLVVARWVISFFFFFLGAQNKIPPKKHHYWIARFVCFRLQTNWASESSAERSSNIMSGLFKAQ